MTTKKKLLLFLLCLFAAASTLLVAVFISEKTMNQDKPVYTAEDGLVKIPTSDGKEKTIEEIWSDPNDITGFTIPERAKMIDGSLGVLEIDAIHLSVNIYEADNEIEAMEQGVAHFKSTSAWDGNVGLCSHNATVSGKGAFFKNLNQLKIGDVITYETALGKRSYSVSEMIQIDASDWSTLSRTEENQITLITCVNGNENIRYCVIAKEITE